MTMIVLNTTFIVDTAIVKEAVDWIKGSYAAAAARARGVEVPPRLMRVLAQPQPGTEAYALHVEFATMDDAAKFDNGVGESLRGLMHKRFGERVVTFVTYLERLD